MDSVGVPVGVQERAEAKKVNLINGLAPLMAEPESAELAQDVPMFAAFLRWRIGLTHTWASTLHAGRYNTSNEAPGPGCNQTVEKKIERRANPHQARVALGLAQRP
jgi:hypothetical protein